MYLAIHILLVNDVVKFPLTVGIPNLRDIVGSCEACEAVITITLG